MRLIGEWNISAVASSAKINNTTSLAAGVESGEVQAPHSMDYLPTRWP